MSLLVMVLALLLLAPTAMAQPPAPQPAPEGPANLFYGAVPPSGTAAPVLVFVHGLGSNAYYWWQGNDMYQQVYSLGYRSAFLSLSADNSNNSDTIARNAAMLKSLLPLVATHYGVSQFYLICHSKGGLDSQAAMQDPALAGLVKAVFTIATPNQGVQLADWAFGPGRSVAALLGLLTPGLYDMRPTYVQSLRAQWDPLFTAMRIPFYTLAGTTSSGGNPVLTVTGAVLDKLSNGQPNDGLVTETESKLSTSYAMELATIRANHFQIATGTNALSFLRGEIDGLEMSLPGFKRIATGGFGDPSNTWAWSMKWFNGKLYVGTGREVTCVSYATSDVQDGTNVYGMMKDCPPDYHDLKLAAEIWRFTPETRTWDRVYKSPEDISLGTGPNGQPRYAARDMGYRGMAIFTEADGTQALYVAGVSTASLYDKTPPYDTQGYPPPRILRTVDGVNWQALPNDPGTFMGDIVKNNEDIKVVGFRSMTVYKGRLFATATDLRGEGFIIVSTTPAQGNNAWQRVSPDVNQLPVWTLIVFNNFLYAATGNRESNDGYGLYKTDAVGNPFHYSPIIRYGGWQSNPDVRSPAGLSLGILNGQLYMGTNRKTELVRANPDDSWELVVGEPRQTPTGYKTPIAGLGQGFGNSFNGHFWEMDTSAKGLHLGTWDWSVSLQDVPIINAFFSAQFGFDLMRSPDGVYWSAVSKNGMGDGLNFGGRNMENTPLGFFVGTARPTGGCQVWLEQSTLDLNRDGVIDRRDIDVLTAAMNQTVRAGDPRDLDGDGRITILDVRKLTTQCTLPGCAQPTVAAAAVSLAPPAPQRLRAAPEGTAGRQAILTWDPSPGAIRYRVYRWTMTPILNFFPPEGITITLPGTNITITLPQDILSGRLDFLCGPQLNIGPLCVIMDLIKAGAEPGSLLGYPTALREVAVVSGTTWQEAAPTTLQSTYVVRAEDGQGRLSEPSNVAGAPSKAAN